MTLFVLGATGRIGREIVDAAIASGHEVTAFVRSPAKIEPRDHLRVVGGDPKDPEAMARAMSGHDAVLSAIGAPPREALRPSTLMTDCATSTLRAMQAADVPRLGIVSAAVLFPEKGLMFAFFQWFLKHHARDLTTMEAAIRASDRRWTIVRPPRLVSGPDDAARTAVGELPPRGSVASFRSVARFLVDAVAGGDHVGEVVGLAR